ncbi:MAG: L-lactate dehydrogenase [Atopobiaceae bacterium]
MRNAAKVGIIGASHVGAHVANALLEQGLVTELFISDRDEALCRAQVNDLEDAMAFYPRAAKVHECDTRYEELAECDVIVNAAGHVAAAQKDRDGENTVTPEEVKTFVPRIMKAGFDGIWVSVSNPNDVVAEAIWQESGHYDWRRVIGSGTTLDSSRFQHALSRATGYDPQSIHSWMLGEHGFSEFACWSHVTFGCLTPEEVEEQAHLKFDRDKLEDEARRGGYITMVGKHCTEYSIARGTVKIVAAILGDTKLVTPVSTRIENVYGITGIWSSLPCVIGASGVEHIFVPEFSDSEIAKWQASCAHIRANVDSLGWLHAFGA